MRKLNFKTVAFKLGIILFLIKECVILVIHRVIGTFCFAYNVLL